MGALSVAALLGAEIAGVPVPVLANAIVKTSTSVAVLLPLLCLITAPRVRFSDLGYAVLVAIAMVIGIVVTNRWVGIEVAGVGGGLAIIAVSLLCAPSRHNLARVLRNAALLPYGRDLIDGGLAMRTGIVLAALWIVLVLASGYVRLTLMVH